MSREKLRKNLLEAVREFGQAFNLRPKLVAEWADGIRKDINRIAILPVGEGQNLVWTKEGGKRKLVFQTPKSHTEVGTAFNKWLSMPWTSELRKRGIAIISLAPHSPRAEEVVWGKDEDVLPPEPSQAKR
ncbi:hypothetical protein A2127_01225 [Candidatus Jorgensenbacteria bacterium GWC1_48_12]|uniref:Uncharacterized protein n=1 Tax=Candidatus Jorgensenbacteria bacterium GWC1_48_12 TaxID=1798469 RepID=A0A1F6BRI4_9BACT|nr:MAG: hypothetical protein A2127_01225 [Candidatus Jorgensenbacteria bacterium GWC1_48_12]